MRSDCAISDGGREALVIAALTDSSVWLPFCSGGCVWAYPAEQIPDIAIRAMTGSRADRWSKRWFSFMSTSVFQRCDTPYHRWSGQYLATVLAQSLPPVQKIELKCLKRKIMKAIKLRINKTYKSIISYSNVKLLL